MFENLIKSLVIQAWSNFEQLTKRLWKFVHDSPSVYFRRPTPKEMNDLKMRFTTRWGIRNAYEFGFRNQTEIMAELSEEKIDPLAILRNCLIHSWGIVDEDFKTQARACPKLSAYHHLEIGDRINFDGKMANEFVHPVFMSGYRLIMIINFWLDLEQEHNS
jgi:hypothetical protein